MTRSLLCTILFLAIAGLARLAPAADTMPAPPLITTHNAYDMPGIEKPAAWFVRKEVHGLSESGGTLLLDGKKLDVPITTAPRVAAAIYSRCGLIVSVQADGSADLYKRSGETWKLHSRLAPDLQCRNASVRLTIVPGLVYLLNYDIKKEAELKGSIVSPQDYADINRRVCLTESAEQYHAVPLDKKDESLLGVAYRQPIAGQSVLLCTSERDCVNIDIGGTPAAPFRSGPGDDLAQSIFIFPSVGIAALTADGWSVCSPSGKNLGVISTRALTGGWWTRPTYHDGNFYVYYQSGPGGTNYRLDTEVGKLVEDLNRP